MLNLKKFFICFILSILLISSCVLATDINNTPVDDVANTPLLTITPSDTVAPTVTAETIEKDLYIYNTDSYSLSDIIKGNVFASTTKFVVNPKNSGGVIKGNLYLISSEAVLGSDVSYSNYTDTNGNYIVTNVNNKTIVNGSVYALSDSFTLESGSEIYGDLYVAADKIDIQQDAVVHGNLFLTASEINLNGQISGSAYITCDNFNMTYFTYIAQDLYLNSTTATLAGIVYRNAFITTYGNLTTLSDFRVTQTLSVDFAKDFAFAGEVQGNAVINAQKLSFKNDTSDDSNKCIIRGNLQYATKTETAIPDGIVSGQVSTAEYVDRSPNKLSLSQAMFNFSTLLVLVFAITFLRNIFAKNTIEKRHSLDIKVELINLAIGFASLFIVFVLLFLLLLSGVGLPLALLLLIAYLLVAGLSLPVVLFNVANTLKLKLHIYVRLLVVTIVFYLISLLPVIGSMVVFALLLIGVGKILARLFNRKK